MKNLKKILITFLFLGVPMSSFAAPTSWDFASGILQPLTSQRTAEVRADHYVATSTASSTLPSLESTISNSLTICIAGDCKSAWPSGGSGSSVYEIATTSGIAVPQVAYFTKTGGRTTLGSVATGTITCSGTGISCNTTGLSVLGGNLTITGSDTNASSTLLSDLNAWSARQDFNANASTTGLTVTGSTYLATAGGNVGVGTANPNSLLQIYGQGADILTVGNGVDTSTSFNVQNRALFGYNQTRAAATVQGIAGRGIDFNVNNSTFGSGQAMVITSAGNVGIGTTNPGALLTVGSSNYLTVTSDWVTASTTYGIAVNGAAGTLRRNVFQTNGSLRWAYYGTGDAETGSNAGSNFLITRYSDAAGFLGNSFSITRSNGNMNLAQDGGNVGIGFGTAPGARLVVKGSGNTSASSALSIQNSDATGLMEILNNGNVGVGTTTPQYLLNPYSATAPQLSLSAGAGVAQWAFRNAGGNLYLATTTVAGTATTTTSALTILNNGNVGVGTVSPTNTLQVKGGVTAGGNILAAAADTYDIGTSGSSNRFRTIYAGNGFSSGSSGSGLILTTGTTQPIYFQINGAEKMRLNAAGSLGIATTTPYYSLTVASTTGPQLSLSAGAGIAQWTMRNAGGNLYFSTTTVAGTATSSVSALSINSNGQITIPGLVSCDSIDTNASGVLSCGTDATGAGGANDFTWESTMGSLNAATSSKVWFKDTINASSTLQFNTNLISEHASLRFLDIQGRAGGDYTLARIKAPRTTPYEATLSLLLDESGDNSGVNESFFDYYNEGYPDSYQAGLRLVNTGTARPKPIVFGHYDDDGLSKNNGNKLTLFPSGTVWIGQGTSTASLATQFHVSSTTATNLLELDGLTGDRFVVTQATSTFRGALAVGTTTVSGTNTQATFSVKGVMNIVAQFFTSAGTKIMEITDAGVTTLLGTWNFGGATVTGLPYYPAFTYSTTTSWTGTTTIPLGVAYNAQTWRGVKCFTDTGTLNVSFYDGTNRMDMFNASTTVGTITLATNNTFTASEKRYVDVGTPASSPTKISCTVSFQDN